MPIQFDCHGCGKHFSVPDKLAGSQAKCNQCGTQVTIPAADATAEAAPAVAPAPQTRPAAAAGRLTCPSCGKQYPWRDQLAGKDVSCQACGTTFTATAPVSAPASSSAKAAPRQPSVRAPAPSAQDDLFGDLPDSLPAAGAPVQRGLPDSDPLGPLAPKPKKKKKAQGFARPEWLTQPVLLGVGIGAPSLLLLAGLAWFLLGSGKDNHEKLMVSTLTFVDSIAQEVANSKDEASAKNAATRIQALRPQIKDLGTRFQKLGKPTPEIEAQLKKRTDLEQRAKQTMQRFEGEMNRIQGNPAVAQIVAPVVMEAMMELWSTAMKAEQTVAQANPPATQPIAPPATTPTAPVTPPPVAPPSTAPVTPVSPVTPVASTATRVWLSDLPEQNARVGYGQLGKRGQCGFEPWAIAVQGRASPHGLGMHPDGSAEYTLDGKYRSFTAEAALNDSAGNSERQPILFQVLGDGKLLWESADVEQGGWTEPCTVDVTGVRVLKLQTLYHPRRRGNGAQEKAHAVWLEPAIDVQPPAIPTAVWQYGYGWYNDAKGRLNFFRHLPHFGPDKHSGGNGWMGGPLRPVPRLNWLVITPMQVHPADSPRAAVRRWVAPRAGVVSIGGQLTQSCQHGDGVRARVVSVRTGIHGEWIGFNSSVATNVARIEVFRGEALDFISDCRTNESEDAHNWAPVITMIEERESNTAGAKTVWDAKADFGGPDAATTLRMRGANPESDPMATGQPVAVTRPPVTKKEPSRTAGNSLAPFPPPPATAPVVKLTLEQIKDGEDSKHFGKWIEYESYIGSIHPDEVNPGQGVYWPKIYLNEKPVAEGFGLATTCYPASPMPWKTAGPGSLVRVRGAQRLGTEMWHAEITLIKGAPVQELAAEQLAREMRADKEQAFKKYHDRMLLVTGKLTKRPAAVDPGELVGANGEVVLLHSSQWRAAFDKVAIGQPVTVAGLGYCISQKRPPEVGLTGGFPHNMFSGEESTAAPPGVATAQPPAQIPTTAPAADSQIAPFPRPAANGEAAKVTLQQLVEDFDARDKYLGKWVEFEAYVGQTLPEEVKPGVYWPLVSVSSTENGGFGTSCYPASPIPWKIADRGSVVRVRGALGRAATLWHAEITLLKGSPVKEFSADQLDREVRTKREQSHDKYHNRTLAVTGTLMKRPEEDKPGRITGPNGGVVLIYDGEWNMGFEKVAIGKPITVVGTCDCSKYRDPPAIYLANAFPTSMFAGAETATVPPPSPTVEPLPAASAPPKKAADFFQEPEPAAGAEVAKIELTELARLVKEDPDKAADRYRGKWVECEGYVRHIDVQGYGSGVWWPAIHIQSSVPDLARPATSHMVGFPQAPDPWKVAGDGAKVRIQGSLDELGALWNCKITLLEGQPTPVVTLDSLLSEFKADATAAAKKYDWKRIVVTQAKLTRTYNRKAEGDDFPAILSGSGANKVWCSATVHSVEQLDSVKVGDTTAVMGKVRYDQFATPPRVLLQDPWALSLVQGAIAPADPTAGVNQATSTPDSKADFEVTAEALTREFNTNKQAAIAKYTGKVIQVTGVTDGSALEANLTITFGGLKPKPDALLANSVACTMAKDEFAKVARLAKGQQATVVGKFVAVQETLVCQPWLGECRVVSIGADKSIKVTALELTRAYVSNAKAAEKRFDDQPVRVTGVISAFNKDAFEVHLKGSGDTKVVFRMGFEGFPQVEAAKKVGDTVTLQGVSSTFVDKEVEVINGKLVE